MSEEENRSSPDANLSEVTFDEIRKKIIRHAESYYPDTYRDFNRTSFGSLMIDAISLVSEQLNFYAHFIANETLSIEHMQSPMVLERKESEVGDPLATSMTSTGLVSFYSLVPANGIESGPDMRYKHKILKGATCTTPEGGVFTTTEDRSVDLEPENLIGTKFTDDAAKVKYFIYKTEIPVISGEIRTTTIDVGSSKRFLRCEVRDFSISEILECKIPSGQEFYQVRTLADKTVSLPLPNITENYSQATSWLMPFPVKRKFVVEKENGRVFLTFGYGSQESTEEQEKKLADPGFGIALKAAGKDYTPLSVFDPSILQTTDKFGIAPQNTTLTVKYRANTTDNTNASVGAVNNVSFVDVLFEDETVLDPKKVSYIKSSITVKNEEPINGQKIEFTSKERATNILAKMGSQGRCVTARDYVAAAYLMPSKFGKVIRASVDTDKNDLRRSLNMFVISQDRFGRLQTASTPLKQNLKTWINSVKMMSDSIDIFDAKILNLGLFFDVALNRNYDYASATAEIRDQLFEKITAVFPQIGQAFPIGEVTKILSSMKMVNRVNSVKVKNKSGENYSNNRIDIAANISPDGGLLYLPNNFIWEIKKSTDISGKVQ